MSKRVGVLGSGQVAQVLAAGFGKHGYPVSMGSREPAKLAAFCQQHGFGVGGLDEVAAGAEVVVLAVKGTAALEAVQAAGPGHLAGKLVIDCTNPIANEPPDNGAIRFFTGPNESLMERLQAAVPAARFVKAWSCVGNAFMVNPRFVGGPPTMFICGNDAAAKAEVTAILDQFGWSTEDMGSVTSARAIEPLCILWCLPGMLRNQWTHAFKLLKL